MNSVFRLPLLVLIFSLLLLPAAAQPPGVPRGIGLGLSVDAECALGNEVDVSRAKWSVDYQLPKVRGGMPGVGLAQEFSRYDFADEMAPEFEASLADARSDEFSLSYRRALRPKWFFFGSATAGSSIERGAEWSSGVTYGFFGAWRYAASETLGLSLGVAGFTRLEDPPMAFPFPAIDWQITDRLSLRTERGVTLAWDMDGEGGWVAELAAAYESHDFRLDDDDVAPRGVLRDNSIPVTVGLKCKSGPLFQARFWLGTTAWQEYELADEDGHSVAKESGNTAVLAGAEAAFQF
ncbi:MAG TPA: hypothetical protein PLE77_10905 [Kiritimatiellia bacterium]|nr:hypothetical protein [Kiritimatiellia bacterium]